MTLMSVVSFLFTGAVTQANTLPSIRMPRALFNDWVTTLRSGEVGQGYSTLLDERGRMCCLGVLQYCAGGHSRLAIERNGQFSEKLPTRGWLAAHGVEFYIQATRHKKIRPNIPSEAPALWFEDKLCWKSASEANDQAATFAEIADLLEKHVEFTD